LLAQPRCGKYKRIASNQNIIAKVKDTAAVRDVMDIRILEILKVAAFYFHSYVDSTVTYLRRGMHAGSQ
jgi:hypothetical protein